MSFDWTKLRNPILADDVYSLKDPCLAFHAGSFYLFYSAFYDEDRSKVIGRSTRDFVTFSDPIFMWGHGDEGWCAPDLARIDETWVLTYQRWNPRGANETYKQLFFSTSTDLIQWGPHEELASEITAGERGIDPAIAKHGDKIYLMWKEWQTPQIAVGFALGPTGWTRLGQPFERWAENAQFIRIDDRWHLMVTAHPPFMQCLIPMEGTGDDEAHWTNWGTWKELDVPLQEGFNDTVRANASALGDFRDRDGYFYRVFCSSFEPLSHSNMGYTLGIARSRDLTRWEFPPGD